MNLTSPNRLNMSDNYIRSLINNVCKLYINNPTLQKDTSSIEDKIIELDVDNKFTSDMKSASVELISQIITNQSKLT